MYPEITPYIRDLIRFRYRLIPYLYDLLWRYHQHLEPMLRPTFHDFPDDPRCFEENDDMLLGSKLLVASVVEPGMRDRKVYLPRGAAWYDYWSGDFFMGGQEIVLPAPWDRPPLLVREASILPLNLAKQHFGQRRDERGFVIFPCRDGGTIEDRFFEDDGESLLNQKSGWGEWKIRVIADAHELQLEVAVLGEVSVATDCLTILLPRQEIRVVRTETGKIASDVITEEWREIQINNLRMN